MNYFRFSKLAIGIIACFFASLLFIMFIQLLPYFIIVALVFLIAGLVLLSIMLFKRYKIKKQEMFFDQEEIVMELTQSQNGETYTAEKTNYVKKLKKKIKSEKAKLLSPFIFTVISAVVFTALLIKYIIGLF